MPDHDDKPDTKQELCEPPPELAGHAAKEPPGGAPDQLIDPDVEPVEPTPGPGRLFYECCQALADLFGRYTDHRLLILDSERGEDGLGLIFPAVSRLNEVIGPRYRVVEVGDTAAIHAKLSPEQARELADGMRGAGGQIKVITPTEGGPPLGRPTPLDATTGEPMTGEQVREIIAYLKGAERAETEPYLGHCLQTPWTQDEKVIPNARRVLLWLLDGPGQLPVAEPCEHDETFASVDDVSRWCVRCGALRVNGEWRLPGTVDDA